MVPPSLIDVHVPVTVPNETAFLPGRGPPAVNKNISQSSIKCKDFLWKIDKFFKFRKNTDPVRIVSGKLGDCMGWK